MTKKATIVPISARAPTAHAMPTPAFAPLLSPPDVDFDIAAKVDVEVELASAAVPVGFVVDIPVVVAELEVSVPVEAVAVVLLLSESVVFEGGSELEESEVEELLSEVVVELA